MHRVGHQLAPPCAGLRLWSATPSPPAPQSAIDDVVLVDDRAGSPSRPISWRTVTNTSGPLAPSLRSTDWMVERRTTRIADADVAAESDAAARPHAARQLVHRRQEAAALRMSVRADLRLARVGQEEQPVAERRHGVAFLRTADRRDRVSRRAGRADLMSRGRGFPRRGRSRRSSRSPSRPSCQAASNLMSCAPCHSARQPISGSRSRPEVSVMK